MTADSDPFDVTPFEQIGDYVVVKPIGRGGFGSVYFVRDATTNAPFAMKVQKKGSHGNFDSEYVVLSLLQDSPFFPALNFYGEHNGLKYIVMELMGPSLSDIVTMLPERVLTPSSALRTAAETLRIITNLHSHGFIHGDIKPSNFLIRPKSTAPICLVDFGLSRPIGDTNYGFMRTSRYASIRSLKGNPPVQADDYMSWFYSIVELAGGKLPWHDLSEKDLILHMKEVTPVEALCASCPKCFLEVYSFLEEKEPDSGAILGVLDAAITKCGFDTDESFDWEIHNLSGYAFSTLRRQQSDSFGSMQPTPLLPVTVTRVDSSKDKITVEHFLLDDCHDRQEGDCCDSCCAVI